MSACLPELRHSPGAVVAHTCHDDADHVLSSVPRRRPEQNIDRGAVARNQRTVPDLGEVPRPAPLEKDVPIARRDQRLAANDRIAIGGLLYRNSARAFQTLRKTRGELGWH